MSASWSVASLKKLANPKPASGSVFCVCITVFIGDSEPEKQSLILFLFNLWQINTCFIEYSGSSKGNQGLGIA